MRLAKDTDPDSDTERSQSTENPKTQVLSYSTMEGYVNAIMDLWRSQHRLKMFPPGFPVPVRPNVCEFNPGDQKLSKKLQKRSCKVRERNFC